MRTIFLVMVTVILMVGPAFAAAPCTVSVKDWQPREALWQKLEGYGWVVQSIKASNGCYHAQAVDARGAEIDAYFDPKSFKVVQASH